MKPSRVLVDTGPLVALFSRQDAAHRSCVAAMTALEAPPLTCWPIITEAAWLLRNRRRGLAALFDAIEQGLVELCPLDANDVGGIRERMTQYASLNPQFADACLVHLAEREGVDVVFTLDRRDFSVYRTKRGKALRILP
ncbi:MAG: type II toxin-antitoxin system VapC family toxin [Acidobacteria bacterium]|nr:type II toxin-antitoxin system VapC family toxin [Acidobacteriota bacterium]